MRAGVVGVSSGVWRLAARRAGRAGALNVGSGGGGVIFLRRLGLLPARAVNARLAASVSVRVRRQVIRVIFMG